MVRAKRKQQSREPTKQEKGHGKQADITQFRSQLDALGLKIVQVTADGNCFFRALADQLEGDEEEHLKYRLTVVEYIRKHRVDFEPFIEDEVPFHEYCKNMEVDGTWAGHMELQAASLVTLTNICIHHHMSPRWYLRNFHSHDAAMIHLSYHDGEHYNSIRSTDDTCGGRARPITIKVDNDISNAYDQAKLRSKNTKGNLQKIITDMKSVKLVMSGTGCKNYSMVEQILKEVNDDTDAAIEYLIAELDANANFTNVDVLSCDVNLSPDVENETHEPGLGHKGGPELSEALDNLRMNTKKKTKDKRHFQGSNKKHIMNGSPTGKSSLVSLSNGKANASVGKRGRKHQRKADKTTKISVHQPADLPDMGALCI